jgi:hypothetical protein
MPGKSFIYSGENISNTMNKKGTRVGGRRELLYGTGTMGFAILRPVPFHSAPTAPGTSMAAAFVRSSGAPSLDEGYSKVQKSNFIDKTRWF